MDFMDLPVMFGRLPPMTDRQIIFANLGGILEDETPPKGKGKTTTTSKKPKSG